MFVNYYTTIDRDRSPKILALETSCICNLYHFCGFVSCLCLFKHDVLVRHLKEASRRMLNFVDLFHAFVCSWSMY